MIRVGTAGWTYQSLIGKRGFYPQELYAKDYLRHYSGKFSTVEVASSFFRIPGMDMVRCWAEQSPADFVFQFQVPGMLTGYPVRPKNLPGIIARNLSQEMQRSHQIQSLPDEVLEMGFDMFLAGLRPVKDAGKLGAIVCRFPPWFEPARASFDYLDLVRDKTQDFDCAMEFLHNDWLRPPVVQKAMEFLKLRNLAWVASDSSCIKGFTGPGGVNSRCGYVRFLGRSNKGRYLYNQKDLISWVERVRNAQSKTKHVYVIFDNHQGADSVLNARLFSAMLKWKG